MSSEEEMKQVVRDLYKAVSEMDLDRVVSYFSDDVKLMVPGDSFGGKDGIHTYYKWLGNQVKGLSFPERTILASGDTIAHEYLLEGTTPEGKAMKVPCVNIYRFEEDKIAELHKYYDRLLVASQAANGLLAENMVKAVDTQMRKGLRKG